VQRRGYRGSVAASAQRVLVVEDDPAIARVLELELGEAGYRVEVTVAGTDGLSAMEREPRHADPDADRPRPGR
jgi:DNA-binding response OmpR family regulator